MRVDYVRVYTLAGSTPPPPLPTATPELGSGELLATGLLPIAGLLLYRRRKDAQARAARDSSQNQDTDDATP